MVKVCDLSRYKERLVFTLSVKPPNKTHQVTKENLDGVSARTALHVLRHAGRERVFARDVPTSVIRPDASRRKSAVRTAVPKLGCARSQSYRTEPFAKPCLDRALETRQDALFERPPQRSPRLSFSYSLAFSRT